MGNLVPNPQWVDVPYFEANAVLTGGPDCPDNLPLKALADRTEFLKGMVENMSLGFDAVPATNKGLFIVVKQPHTRMMMWNGTQYDRAPWHQPCQLFFSYDNPASIPGALPVRADVSYQQSNYPDVVRRLGLSGSGIFTLVEARGEFLRVLDNGRGVDAGRVKGTAQTAYAGYNTITVLPYGIAPSPGIVNITDAIIVNGIEIGQDEAETKTVDVTPGDSRPRNIAFPLWMTI